MSGIEFSLQHALSSAVQDADRQRMPTTALIVLRSKGPKATAYGIHGATAVVMLVISVLLFVG